MVPLYVYHQMNISFELLGWRSLSLSRKLTPPVKRIKELFEASNQKLEEIAQKMFAILLLPQDRKSLDFMDRSCGLITLPVAGIRRVSVGESFRL